MRSLIAAFIVSIAIVSSAQAQTSGQQSADLSRILQSASPRASIGGVEYRLEVKCWLDFMPPVPKSGAPLYALVTVEALEAPLAPGLSITGVWIVLPGGLLPAARLQHRAPDSTNRLQAVATFDGTQAAEAAVRVSVALSAAGPAAYLTSDVTKVDRVY